MGEQVAVPQQRKLSSDAIAEELQSMDVCPGDETGPKFEKLWVRLKGHKAAPLVCFLAWTSTSEPRSSSRSAARLALQSVCSLKASTSTESSVYVASKTGLRHEVIPQKHENLKFVSEVHDAYNRRLHQ